MDCAFNDFDRTEVENAVRKNSEGIAYQAEIQEFTATNTPQQNGISQRDERAVVDVARCRMCRSGLPTYLGGGVCCTTVYTINTLLYVRIDDDTPYHPLFGEQASLSHLCVAGARAFVHHERPQANTELQQQRTHIVSPSPASAKRQLWGHGERRSREARGDRGTTVRFRRWRSTCSSRCRSSRPNVGHRHGLVGVFPRHLRDMVRGECDNGFDSHHPRRVDETVHNEQMH